MTESTDSSLLIKHSPRWLRNFLPMWLGQAFSLLGSAVVQFALVWHLTETTGSATVLAMATFIALIPGVLLGPFAGALVDRWNRKKIMVYFDLIVASATAVLVLLFAFDLIQVWHIYTAMFLRSLAGCFQWPAASASTSMMVPDEHITRVSGANQTVNGAINIVAPPLGALLIASIPMFGVLMVDIITATIAIVLLVFFVTVPQPAKSENAQSLSVRAVTREVIDGLKYAFHWKGLFLLLIFAAIVNFAFSPAFSLMPLLVTRHFGLGAQDLAWLESSFGAGIIAGGLLLSIWGGFKRKMVTSMIGMTGMGIGTILLGLAGSSQFWLALVAGATIGFMNPIGNGPLFAVLQAKVPHEMQGKIFSVVNSLASAAAPLGMLLAAPVANALGIQAWFIIAGAVCATMGLGAFFVKPLITLDLQQPGGSADPENLLP